MLPNSFANNFFAFSMNIGYPYCSQMEREKKGRDKGRMKGLFDQNRERKIERVPPAKLSSPSSCALMSRVGPPPITDRGVRFTTISQWT